MRVQPLPTSDAALSTPTSMSSFNSGTYPTTADDLGGVMAGGAGMGRDLMTSPPEFAYPVGGYRPPDGLSWSEEGAVGDFDFDGFLANFGVHSDITNLFS